MSIEALILGKLHAAAEQRTAAQSGRQFVTAKVRAALEAGDSVFVNVIAFSESAAAALLALEAGDPVALAGTIKPGAWIDREGKPRPSVDMVAAQVLTPYALAQRRKAAVAAADRQRQSAGKEAVARHGNAEFPEDEAWLRGEA